MPSWRSSGRSESMPLLSSLHDVPAGTMASALRPRVRTCPLEALVRQRSPVGGITGLGAPDTGRISSVIDGLDEVLAGSGQRGLLELRAVLQELFSRSGSTGRVIRQQRLKRSVYRLQVEAESGLRSLVLKRLDPSVAQRNQLVATRWLPALGLSDNGPALLGVAAERSGRCVWHLYEDMGDRTLAAS